MPYFHSLLTPYKTASLEIQKKARMLLFGNYVLIFGLLVGGIVINLLIEFRPTSASFELATAALIMSSLYFLGAGHYTTASTLTIIVLLAGMGIAGFLGYSDDPFLNFTLLGYNLLPVILYSCLIGYQWYQPLLATGLSLAVNLGFFLAYFVAGSDAGHLIKPLSILVNSTLLLGISGVMAFLILRTNRELVAIDEEEKERLLVTLRSIGDGVITTDIGGRVLLMNRVAEELTGWPMADAAGRPLTEVLQVINELTREKCENPVEKVLKSGVIVEMANHTTLVSRNGVERVIADSGAPIRDRKNRIVGVVLVFRDITEKRQIERSLQNAAHLEALGVLAGGIAHDFNNLLTGIFGYMELARNDAVHAPKIITTLDKALGVCGRARDLTRQLLTFSKGSKPAKQIMSLSPLLRNSAQFILSGSTIKLEMQISGDLWPCEIDQNQFGQVIDNVVLNARQAMPAGGAITIRATNTHAGDLVPPPLPSGNYVHIVIEDQGTGIPAANLVRIFDPFFTTKTDGNGLGLATAYSIIRHHEGLIEAKSELGRGSEFHIYIPAKPEHEIPVVQPDTAAWKGHGRILVMDDEGFNRDVLQQMLGLMGYTATCCRDGYEAIRIFISARAENLPFEAVILDLTIPGGMSGKKTLNRLLEIEPNVIAVAASGYSNDPILADPSSCGFKDFLHKPFTSDELGRVLRRVLGNMV